VETRFSVSADSGHRLPVLVLAGEFDGEAVALFEQAISGYPAGLPLIADLAAVTFLGSSGIRALFQAATSARLSALVRPPESHLARVLDIVKVDAVVPLFDDVAQAIDRLPITARSGGPTAAARIWLWRVRGRRSPPSAAA